MIGPKVPELVPVVKAEKIKFDAWELSAITLLLASFNTKVAVAVPPAVKLELESVKVECVGDTDPVLTVMVGTGVDVTALPPTVAVTLIAVPALTPVKTAV